MSIVINDNVLFAKRLKEKMGEAGMTQNRLSQISGVAVQQISRYSRAITCARPDIVKRLAAALGCSFLWLYSGEDENKNKDESHPADNSTVVFNVVPRDPALRNAWFDGFQFALRLNLEVK